MTLSWGRHRWIQGDGSGIWTKMRWATTARSMRASFALPLLPARSVHQRDSLNGRSRYAAPSSHMAPSRHRCENRTSISHSLVTRSMDPNDSDWMAAAWAMKQVRCIALPDNVWPIVALTPSVIASGDVGPSSEAGAPEDNSVALRMMVSQSSEQWPLFLDRSTLTDASLHYSASTATHGLSGRPRPRS